MPKTISLNIYGPIVDQSFWGDLVTPRSVMEKIKDAGPGDQIDVHINSPGGNVFAGQAIHNMLRQHPAKVNMFVDGIAASVASVIAMAGNKIVMPPGTMMMIHNPLLSLFGAYHANEFREMADYLDKVRDSIVATYMSRNKNKTKEDIVAIMDATTWMTAAEAVDAGWADEVMEAGTVEAKMSGKVLNIAGMDFDLSSYACMPAIMNSIPAIQSMKVTGSSPDLTADPAANKQKHEEDTILDRKELQEKHPEIYNEILNAGVAQERARMKALDEVAMPGHEAIINDARYTSGSTAEQVAIKIIAAEKATNAQRLKDIAADAADLTPVGGAAAPADAKAKEEKEVQAMAEKMAAQINEGRGK